MELTILWYAMIWTVLQVLIILGFGFTLVKVGQKKGWDKPLIGALSAIILLSAAAFAFGDARQNQWYTVRSIDSTELHQERVQNRQIEGPVEIVTPEPRTSTLDGFQPLGE